MDWMANEGEEEECLLPFQSNTGWIEQKLVHNTACHTYVSAIEKCFLQHCGSAALGLERQI
jgi:hypothetical protein